MYTQKKKKPSLLSCHNRSIASTHSQCFIPFHLIPDHMRCNPSVSSEDRRREKQSLTANFVDEIHACKTNPGTILESEKNYHRRVSRPFPFPRHFANIHRSIVARPLFCRQVDCVVVMTESLKLARLPTHRPLRACFEEVRWKERIRGRRMRCQLRQREFR